MSNGETVDSVRRHLLVLARRKSAWDVVFTKARPKEWRPGSVIDPSSNQPFTNQGAKDFVVGLLESDHPLEEITLDTPPEKKGYVMRVGTKSGRIYIKLELGSGKIIGRSFHYDKR